MIEIPALVPEIDVTDLTVCLSIYTSVFGFQILSERRDEAFAYLGVGQAHLMMQAAAGPGRRFRTAPLRRPYGRGINFQVNIPDSTDLYREAQRASLEIIMPVEDRWYGQSEIERGNRQFVVADPDGYLIRFYENLGVRYASVPD